MLYIRETKKWMKKYFFVLYTKCKIKSAASVSEWLKLVRLLFITSSVNTEIVGSTLTMGRVHWTDSFPSEGFSLCTPIQSLCF